MPKTSDKILKVSSETLVIGFAVFLFLVMLDRMSNTTYFRDSFWTLLAASLLIIAPTISASYHLARWVSKPQGKIRTSR
ncbi:MAG: hypothetical protein ABSG69_01860 [Candidatus Acidiferrum sp.]|jgi:hypothetical protein